MKKMVLGGIAVVVLAAAASGQCNPRCPGDLDGDGLVEINELVRAVDAALNGCLPSLTPMHPATPTGTRTGSPTTTPTPSPTATAPVDRCRDVPTRSAEELRLRRVVSGLRQPVGIAAPPDGTERLFVLEQAGRIRVIRNGELRDTPFLDLTEKVECCREKGLLGLAFHPDFASNGELFVNYTGPAEVEVTTFISRFRLDPENPDQADPTSEEIVIELPQPSTIHNGGHLVFGPDGFLYIALGDGGPGGDPNRNGQNTGTVFGSILRIDVDGGMPYAIPPDNPFVGVEGAREEIWAYGLRNPWKISFDHATGDMYLGDVGEVDWEEINVVPAGTSGLNFGWVMMQGRECFKPRDCSMQGLTLPVIAYEHGPGCASVTGGVVYRGCSMPDLRGTYFYSDFCLDFIRSFVLDEGQAAAERDWTEELGLAEIEPVVTCFGEDARGEIYLCDYRGNVYALESTVEATAGARRPGAKGQRARP